MDRLLSRFLLDPAPLEGGASATPPTPPSAPPPPKSGENGAADEGWKALVAKNNNDLVAVTKQLFDENYKLRHDKRELKQKAVPDGAVVLTGDDAKSWQGFQELGKLTDIQNKLSEHAQLSSQAAAASKAKLFEEVGQASGFKPSVLATLAQRDELQIEVREVGKTSRGEPLKKAYVLKQGDSAEQSLEDYATKNWTDFLPSLKTERTPAYRAGTPSPRDSSPAAPRFQESGVASGPPRRNALS